MNAKTAEWPGNYARPFSEAIAVELRDVVLVAGDPGCEDVFLRGADLRIFEGERLLITGLDARSRQVLADILTGHLRPRYGHMLTNDLASVAVVDGGSKLVLEDLNTILTRPAQPALVILAEQLIVPDETLANDPDLALIDRRFEVTGGRFIEIVSPKAVPTVVPIDQLVTKVRDSITLAGADTTTAELVSRVLVDAERRGHPSHGVALLPTYLSRAAAGGIDPRAVPTLVEVSPSVAVIDANGGYGPAGADLAARWCGERAADHGMAAVAVRNNNHVGMLAAYRNHFQRAGAVGLLLNISGPSVVPPHATRPTLGSNAICMVVPNGSDPDSEPFCLDFATGIVAAGKVRDASNRGEAVPLGWLLDRNGRPSTDPRDMDNGGGIPLFGGYKGLCVTMIAEILGGALAGGVISADVGKQRKHLDEPMRCTQLFIGLSVQHFGNPDLRMHLNRLRSEVALAYDTSPDRPWFPDQAETDHAELADRVGVSVPTSVMKALRWL